MSFFPEVQLISYYEIQTFIPIEYMGRTKTAQTIQNYLKNNELLVIDHPMDHPNSGKITIYYPHSGTATKNLIKSIHFAV